MKQVKEVVGLTNIILQDYDRLEVGQRQSKGTFIGETKTTMEFPGTMMS